MATIKFYDTVSLDDVDEIIPQFSNHFEPIINLSEEDVYITLRDADNAIVVIANGLNDLLAFLDEIQTAVNEYGVNLDSAERVLVNIRISISSDFKMSDIQPLTVFFGQFSPDTKITWGIAKDSTLSASAIGVDILCANIKSAK